MTTPKIQELTQAVIEADRERNRAHAALQDALKAFEQRVQELVRAQDRLAIVQKREGK